MIICPLCNDQVHEDEESKEVWHSPPSVKPIWARGTAESSLKVAGYESEDDFHMLGRPIGQTAAILNALDDCSGIDVESHGEVEEVHAVGDPIPKAVVETSRNTGKAGATIKVEPPEPPEPDDIMHKECHEAIFEDNQ